MSLARPTRRQRQLLLLLAAAVLLVVWVWMDNAATTEDDRSETPAPSSQAPNSQAPSSQAARDNAPEAPEAPESVPEDGAEDGATDPDSGLPWVALQSLPPEAADTLDLIDAGGPFPYDRDGVTFENRERILPDRQRGYYREYTVPTPGSDDRGARRIVTGSSDELYWTQDHYDSFERIRR